MLDNEKTNPVREALNVRRLRVAAGLSQAELADRMGVDRAYVSGLELGQRNPTIVTLWHIAKALGVKLRLFFNEGKPGRAELVRWGGTLEHAAAMANHASDPHHASRVRSPFARMLPRVIDAGDPGSMSAIPPIATDFCGAAK